MSKTIKQLVIVAFKCDEGNAVFYKKLNLEKLTMQEAIHKIAVYINNGILNDADFFSLRVVSKRGKAKAQDRERKGEKLNGA